MPWAEVQISLSGEHAAEAEAVLESLGALAVTLLDDADQPVLEPAPGATPLWPVVQVRGLFAADVPRGPVLERLLAVTGVARASGLRWREVADQDWERAWMDRFQPLRFGERLWIVPSGMEGPGDPAALILRLDPGLAFGTGTHPTTALCLDWIDGHDCSGEQVIDYGCGSGVLGIAAALKGAAGVIGVDIDPQALEATRANAERNGVTGLMLFQDLPAEHRGTAKLFGDLSEEQSGTADVVLANILAGPLIELAPRLSALLRPGGFLVLSGILAEQAGQVAAAYAPFTGPLRQAEKEGWVRLEGRRQNGGAP